MLNQAFAAERKERRAQKGSISLDAETLRNGSSAFKKVVASRTQVQKVERLSSAQKSGSAAL